MNKRYKKEIGNYKDKTDKGNYAYADYKDDGSLKISFSRPTGSNKFDRESFVIPSDVMQDFYSKSRHPMTIEERRQKDGQSAYTKWSDEDEQKLLSLFDSGMSIGGIASEFNRSYGAIGSRLKKLGKII